MTWVRLRDPETGHTFDWPADAARGAVDRGEAEPVEHVPNHDDPQPRPPKHNVGLDGKPKSKRSTGESPADNLEATS